MVMQSRSFGSCVTPEPGDHGFLIGLNGVEASEGPADEQKAGDRHEYLGAQAGGSQMAEPAIGQFGQPSPQFPEVGAAGRRRRWTARGLHPPARLAFGPTLILSRGRAPGTRIGIVVPWHAKGVVSFFLQPSARAALVKPLPRSDMKRHRLQSNMNP